MVRRLLGAAALLAAGAMAATWCGRGQAPLAASAPAPAPAPAGRGFPVAAARGTPTGGDLAQRVRGLEERLAVEAVERQRLQARLDELSAELARLGDDRIAPAAAAPAEVEPPAAAADAGTATAPDAAPPGVAQSDLERALVAAGLDADAAAEVKRHGDALAMAEMYLRDQATRESWLDTPRFQEEMAAIDAQRYSIRDELGDEAYDRYLYALGRSNRIRVDDVMSDSPAAAAGLQTGDMILRYGDTRVFAPDELVAQTRQGTPGERVRVEVIRQGELLTVEVPRGPLGLRIAATQSTPRSG